MGTPVTSLVTATESVDQKTSQSFVLPAAKTTTARVYKNLIVVGVMLLLSYASTAPTVTLVTSVAGETLGNVTFCLNYVLSCLFNFVSIPVLGNGASKKKVMIIGNVCLVGFTACNWYVSYYTLIPGAILFGFGVTLVWIASLMYTSRIAINHAERCDLSVKGLISFFTGIVIALSNTGYLVGSATAAGVLTLLKHDTSYYNSTDLIDGNFTMLDDWSNEECQTNDDKLEIGFVTTNVLRGIIFFYSLLALAVILFFLDDIDGQTENPHANIHVAEALSGFFKTQWRDIVAIAKVFIKKEMTLSCLQCFALGASVSFMFARFSKVNFFSYMCIVILLVKNAMNTHACTHMGQLCLWARSISQNLSDSEKWPVKLVSGYCRSYCIMQRVAS